MSREGATHGVEMRHVSPILCYTFLVRGRFGCLSFMNWELGFLQKGQLGHGDTIQRDRPTVVSELKKCAIFFYQFVV